MRRAAASVLLLAALAACREEQAPTDPDGARGATADPQTPATTPTPVEGAVLSVGGVPILREELDRLVAAAELVSPEFTRPHHERVVLETELIPRAALASARGEARAAAEAKARAALERLRSDPAAAAELGVETKLLDVRQLGLEPWATLVDGARGAWLGPAEQAGRFRLVRWTARTPAPSVAEARFTCDVLDFWYLPEPLTRPYVDDALSEARLEVHDPALAERVSERMRWRLRRD